MRQRVQRAQLGDRLAALEQQQVERIPQHHPAEDLHALAQPVEQRQPAQLLADQGGRGQDQHADQQCPPRQAHARAQQSRGLVALVGEMVVHRRVDGVGGIAQFGWQVHAQAQGAARVEFLCVGEQIAMRVRIQRALAERRRVEHVEQLRETVQFELDGGNGDIRHAADSAGCRGRARAPQAGPASPALSRSVGLGRQARRFPAI
ncbi:hypothetical protein [Metallibacterium sp.]|uniref:hypothetical protein n=1 Tax=Metallibacterium sp. TaxID=2940281 RepID=UPI00260E7224|nr:hypothetical protein [Metallibacterium sp.]